MTPTEELVTHTWLSKLLTGIAERMNERHSATESKVLRLLQTQQQLLQRVAALEAAMANHEHKGVWQSGTVYRKHNAATYSGSTWTCRAAQTQQQPGTGMDWVLTTKRGKDGRDGRDAA